MVQPMEYCGRLKRETATPIPIFSYVSPRKKIGALHEKTKNKNLLHQQPGRSGVVVWIVSMQFFCNC
jgi:hypothetical protein